MKFMRRSAVAAMVIAITCMAPSYAGNDLSGKVVWYDVSGGANTAAKTETVFEKFTAESGVRVITDFGGSASATRFFAGAEAGYVPWDVIELTGPIEFNKAIEMGYLAPLDKDVVPVDKLEPGTYNKYGYQATRYGVVLVWNPKYMPEGKAPNSAVDFYDLDAFPGPRCLFNNVTASAVFESALFADGVTAENMYPLDVDRALSKLEAIKDHIVWWNAGDQAIQYLATGQCVMGYVWSGRVYNAIISGANLKFTWNDSIWTPQYFAVAKASNNPAAAQALLGAWLKYDKARLQYVKKIPYPTPVRGMDYPEELKKFLPVGDNLSNSVKPDPEYFSKNISELTKRLNRWLIE